MDPLALTVLLLIAFAFLWVGWKIVSGIGRWITDKSADRWADERERQSLRQAERRARY